MEELQARKKRKDEDWASFGDALRVDDTQTHLEGPRFSAHWTLQAVTGRWRLLRRIDQISLIG